MASMARAGLLWHKVTSQKLLRPSSAASPTRGQGVASEMEQLGFEPASTWEVDPAGGSLMPPTQCLPVIFFFLNLHEVEHFSPFVVTDLFNSLQMFKLYSDILEQSVCKTAVGVFQSCEICDWKKSWNCHESKMSVILLFKNILFKSQLPLKIPEQGLTNCDWFKGQTWSTARFTDSFLGI